MSPSSSVSISSVLTAIPLIAAGAFLPSSSFSSSSLSAAYSSLIFGTSVFAPSFRSLSSFWAASSSASKEAISRFFDDTDGLSPRVTSSYSRTWRWEKETQSSFLSPPDLLADDRKAFVEDLLLLIIDVDVDVDELIDDLSVKSVVDVVDEPPPPPPHFRARLNSSFLSPHDLLADDRLAYVENLLLLDMDIDVDDDLRHDLSVKSVDT